MTGAIAAPPTADDVVRLLALKPHPEGGFYRETFRDGEGHDGRAASTLIYFLLRAGEISAWHRVDAAEAWHHYAGAPLRLQQWQPGGPLDTIELGPDLFTGQRPQHVVPKGAWQMAESLALPGGWTLVGCSVAPGFDFAGFEMAPPGWQPEAALPSG